MLLRFSKCPSPPDGVRLRKYHRSNNSAYGSAWAVGDAIGFEASMRTAGAAVMSVSVNGSFGDPNGVAFNNISAAYLSPAFTGYRCYRANMGDRPFLHAPPDAEYVSVQEFDQRNARPECAEDDERPVSGVFLPALLSADAYAREFELRVRILNLEHSAYFGSS